MRIALVHDDLIQWGGAEKVLAEISNIFPDAPIYTATLNLQNQLIYKNFKDKKIVTTFLQKMPFRRTFYKALMPIYPIAFEQFNFDDFDLVISQTTRFAKCVITKPTTKHICYIHTPPRFLWNLDGKKESFFKRLIFKNLQNFDLVSSKRPDFYFSGSKNCQERVQKIYGQNSEILLPFVDTDKFNLTKSWDGDYYLLIARLNKYKNVDIAVKAFNASGKKLKIIGKGPELKNLIGIAKDNIEFLGKVSDELLESLLSGCKGLVVTAEEDFGLTPIEAQAFGKAVVAFGKGGAQETIIPGKTGVYFNELNVESLNKAIETFESIKFKSEDCFENAQKFSKEKFKKRLLELVDGYSKKEIPIS